MVQAPPKPKAITPCKAAMQSHRMNVRYLMGSRFANMCHKHGDPKCKSTQRTYFRNV